MTSLIVVVVTVVVVAQFRAEFKVEERRLKIIVA